MGIISDLKAVHDVQKIKNGKTVKLSISQIVNLIINLQDASSNLSKDCFNQIYSLYQRMRKCKTKIPMNHEVYIHTAIEIIKEFDTIAPYEVYSGGAHFEFTLLMRDIFGKHHRQIRELRRELAAAERDLELSVASLQKRTEMYKSYTSEMLKRAASQDELVKLFMESSRLNEAQKRIAELEERIEELLNDC